mmetsp:Transcript_13070/g.20803  ORF Transcript_13070/g.20803 Transcript_13070/m.20803 type:complete len:439 (-) Transcript_13070:326-1642(-)
MKRPRFSIESLCIRIILCLALAIHIDCETLIAQIVPPAYADSLDTWCSLSGDDDGLTTACTPKGRTLSGVPDLGPTGLSSYRSYMHAIGNYEDLSSKKVEEEKQKERIRIQVITDIDDTIKSSGGKRLAGVPLGGIDVQYQRGQFYPGVFQFEYELAKSQFGRDGGSGGEGSGRDHWHAPWRRRGLHGGGGGGCGVKPLPVAVLTARAKEFKFALELKAQHPVCLAFHDLAEQQDGDADWGIGPVLYGSVREWVLQNLKGQRKFDNFELLKEQRAREAAAAAGGGVVRYVFVGDTGEMDQQAGERMIETYPDQMLALFMHVVSEEKQVSQLPPDKAVSGVPVLFFRTYVGAARKALRHGLLDSRAVLRVIRKAQEDLKEAGVPRTSSKWKDLQKDINRTKQLVTRRALEENTVKATRAAERIIGGGYRFLERYVSWSS